MTAIYLSLGSNIEPEYYLAAGVARLENLLGPLSCSTVWHTEAVGFEGPDFLNMVVGADTELSLAALLARLREIETALGRPPEAKSFTSRTLDIDLLLYGNLITRVPVTLPRPDIERYAFVLRPLAEIAGEFCCPGQQRTFRQMWEDRAGRAPAMHAVPFPSLQDDALHSGSAS